MRDKLFRPSPPPRISEIIQTYEYTGPDIPVYSVSTFKGLAYFCTVDYAGRPRHRIRPVYTSLCAKTNTSNRSNRGHYAYERRRRRRLGIASTSCSHLALV